MNLPGRTGELRPSRTAFVGAALLALACAAAPARSAPARSDAERSAPARSAVPRGTFWTGADLSQLPEREGRGTKYLDAQGQADLLLIARRSGWNMIRVRLWVEPEDKPEKAVSNLEHVTALGKRIKAAGLGFMLDIHFSDTWADPGQQRKPAAWDALPFAQLVQKVRDYSCETLAHLRQAGALPDAVQIGNETRNGLLYGSGLNGAGPQPGGGFWEKAPGGRDRAVQLLQAGLDGVRAGAEPEKAPLTIVHIPDGQDPEFVAAYFRDLHASARAQNIALDYDIIALSYYPGNPWDARAGYPGWAMERLAESMKLLAQTYGKPVLVVETAWPRRGEPRKMPGEPQFPFTPAGQADYYRALIAAVKAVPDGLGLGVLPWDQDSRSWDSVFDDEGRALPAVRVLGQIE